MEDSYSSIVSLMGEENAPPPNYFLEVYGRMVINSFNVLDPIDQVNLQWRAIQTSLLAVYKVN